MTHERFIKDVEEKPEVIEVTKVLRELEKQGLLEPSVASGWTRGWITGIPPSDIDIQYSGKISREDAQKILLETLETMKISKDNWDVAGMWNTERAKGMTPAQYYLVFFVDSIDSCYLAADGRFHDPTGFGFEDARAKVLRMNDFKISSYPYTDEDIVYLCLRGCERIAKHGWIPTERSVELLSGAVSRWQNLAAARHEFLIRDYILAKHKRENFEKARNVYAKYGWGFVFDEAMNMLKTGT